MDNTSYEIDNEELQWFYLDIEFERAKESFCEELNARLDEIKKVKASKIAQRLIYNGEYSRYSNYQGNDLYQGTLFSTAQSTQVGRKVTQSYMGQEGSADSIKEKEEPPFDFDHINNKISEKIPYGQRQFDKKTIKSLVLQLITGSVIIPNSSKIDIEKWAQGMVTLYDSRFGRGECGLKLFKTWAENYIEFLCWFSEDNNLAEMGYQDDELAAVCAHDIIEELTKLPMNKYIKTYIDILQEYLI